VGLGADHQRFAEAGAILDGIDLTQRAVSLTEDRLCQFGLKSNLKVGDVESLAYPDDQQRALSGRARSSGVFLEL